MKYLIHHHPSLHQFKCYMIRSKKGSIILLVPYLYQFFNICNHILFLFKSSSSWSFLVRIVFFLVTNYTNHKMFEKKSINTLYFQTSYFPHFLFVSNNQKNYECINWSFTKRFLIPKATKQCSKILSCKSQTILTCPPSYTNPPLFDTFCLPHFLSLLTIFKLWMQQVKIYNIFMNSKSKNGQKF